jgi:hypothetical protein
MRALLGAGQSEDRRNWRAIAGRLLEQGKLGPEGYLAALAQGPGPQNWAFALFIFFGAAQLIAGIVFFFAYNWRELGDLAKVALPQIFMGAGFVGWALLPARSRLGAISGILATVMIGVSMGVVGQVYQLGADPWTLFAAWAALALPLALIARNDAHFTVWALIASTAYFLYADEMLRPLLLQPDSAIPAVYAAAMFALLAVRDFAVGRMPRWQRWLFAAALLVTALVAANGEIWKDRLFAGGGWSSAALLAFGAALAAIYGRVRADGPTQALALFCVAFWFGALGVRLIVRSGDFDRAGEASLLLIASAIWIVAVTAALAFVLRKTGIWRREASS